jgi:hypothetical protein
MWFLSLYDLMFSGFGGYFGYNYRKESDLNPILEAEAF